MASSRYEMPPQYTARADRAPRVPRSAVAFITERDENSGVIVGERWRSTRSTHPSATREGPLPKRRILFAASLRDVYAFTISGPRRGIVKHGNVA